MYERCLIKMTIIWASRVAVMRPVDRLSSLARVPDNQAASIIPPPASCIRPRHHLVIKTKLYGIPARTRGSLVLVHPKRSSNPRSWLIVLHAVSRIRTTDRSREDDQAWNNEGSIDSDSYRYFQFIRYILNYIYALSVSKPKAIVHEGSCFLRKFNYHQAADIFICK